MIKQALILGAGLGTRMRELTKDIPKPMVEVAGRSLITRLIDQLIEYGISRIVINVFYKADRLMEHVKAHMQSHPAPIDVFFSEESELLETGGGIINALKYLENKPFFVVNADAMFVGEENAFAFLNKQWQDSMNALFLLTPLTKAIGYDGKGDFALDKSGQIANSENPEYVFIGAHISKPEIFASQPIEKIKLMAIYSKFLYRSSSLPLPSSRRRPGPSPINNSPKGSSTSALATKENKYHPLGGVFVGLGPGLRRDDGRERDDASEGGDVFYGIYGAIYPGQWLHIGTPEALKEASSFVEGS